MTHAQCNQAAPASEDHARREGRMSWDLRQKRDQLARLARLADSDGAPPAVLAWAWGRVAELDDKIGGVS